MSEMTRCNRCNLDEVKRRHPGQKVTTGAPVDPKMAGWIQVFVDGKPFAMWFVELTPECCC